MADEITINSSFIINGTTLQAQTKPTQFKADMAGELGPSPGGITVTDQGKSIDFSELSYPSMCRVFNLSVVETVMIGLRNTSDDVFVPIIDLLPAEFYVFRLSALLGQEIDVSGTGTGTGASDWELYARVLGEGEADIVVEAYDK